jgi:hypothetical protein
MALEDEIKTYEARLHTELLAHEGKFVVIHGHEIAGYYDSYREALLSGYDRFELSSFLVKRIQAVEQTQFAS